METIINAFIESIENFDEREVMSMLKRKLKEKKEQYVLMEGKKRLRISKERAEKAEAERKAKEEEERVEAERKVKEEEERKVKEEADKKAKEVNKKVEKKTKKVEKVKVEKKAEKVKVDKVKYPNAGARWTKSEVEKLYLVEQTKENEKKLAKDFGRTQDAINFAYRWVYKAEFPTKARNRIYTLTIEVQEKFGLQSRGKYNVVEAVEFAKNF